MIDIKETLKNNIETNTKKVLFEDRYIIWIKGIFAGLFIATGGLASSIVASTAASFSIAKILGALVFPIGLIMIVFICGELFTGDCLAFNAVATRKIPKMKYIIPFLIFVWLANFTGSFLFAEAAIISGVINTEVSQYILGLAAAKANSSFVKLFVSSILCNLFVCAAIIFSGRSNTTVGKILGIFIPIFTFVVCGFEHCVADMFYMGIAFLLDEIGYIEVLRVVGITTLGNIIGGSGFGLFMMKCFNNFSFHKKELN